MVQDRHQQQNMNNIAMPNIIDERVSSCSSFSTRRSYNFHSIDNPQDDDCSAVSYDLAENAYIPYSTVRSSGPPSLPLKFPEPTANKAVTVSTDVIDHTTRSIFRASSVLMRRPNHCKDCEALTPPAPSNISPTHCRTYSNEAAQFSAFNTPRAPVAGAATKKPHHHHKRTHSNSTTPLKNVPCRPECDLPDVAYCVRRKICETTYGSIKLCVVLKRVNRNMGNAKIVDQGSSGFDTLPGRSGRNSLQRDFKVDQLDQSILPEEPTWETTDEMVAVKVTNLAKYRSLHGRSPKNPINELASLQLLGNYHSNIICLVDALQNDTHLFTVTPYISGGDLASCVIADMENTPNGTVRQSQAKFWFQQLLSAISHLQKKGVCHRDLSMNNIVVDDYGDLRIVDFGLCLRVPFGDPNNRHLVTDVSADTSRRLMKGQEQAGSFAYMSPEVYLNTGVFDGFAVDLWSAGILLFEMLVGKKPFAMPDPNDTNFRRISIDRDLNGFLQAKNIHLDASIVNLLQKMLMADPQQRLTLSEIICHPWLRGSHGEASPEPSAADRMSSWFVANDAIDDAGDMNLSQFNRLRADTTSTIFTLEKEMMDMDENTIGSSDHNSSPYSDILNDGFDADRPYKPPKSFPRNLKSKSWWRGVIKTIYASISSLVGKKSNMNDITTFSGEGNQINATGSLC